MREPGSPSAQTSRNRETKRAKACSAWLAFYKAKEVFVVSVKERLSTLRLQRTSFLGLQSLSATTGCYKTTGIYFLRVLQTGSPQTRCWQAPRSLKALGENLFQAFLLVSGVASNPWLSLACRHATPISASVITWCSPCVSLHIFSLCTSVCVFSPLLIRTPVRLD